MTHDISSTPAESDPCMWGSATLVMLVSRTCITVTIITDAVMAHFRKGESGSGFASGAGGLPAGGGSRSGAAGPARATLRLPRPLGILLGLALIFLAAAVAPIHPRPLLSHSAPFLLSLLYM